MSDYKELARRLRMRMSEPVDWKLYTDSADAIENLSAQLEAEEDTNDRLRDEIAEAVGARERMAAEVERWRDPESDKRQKLQEEIIFSLGDGARSEVELREGQLDATEAALALARAELDRYRESDLGEAVQRLDETKDAEIERLKQELAEALAARETYAMTARQDMIEKAQALDELEAYLRLESVPDVRIEPRAEAEDTPVYFALCIDYRQIDCEGPTIAAAIRAALEKARGA